MATLPPEKKVGREPIVLVQIDQDFCNNTYGVAPCTASGASKCFNTLKTCQDSENYDRGVLTLTFAKAQLNLPLGENIIPSLMDSSTAPSVINPSTSNRDTTALGQRAVASLSFEDHPHSDFLVDPYVAERSYNPFERSSFWAKWLARNPYYQNRPLRIYDGYIGQPLAEMNVRHYLIDKINGPDNNGKVKLTAKDPLNLADKEKSQVPAAVQGKLLTAINTTDTQIDIANAVLTDYATSGTVRLGDEIMTYTTRALVNIGGVDYVRLSGITRATDGSEAKEHKLDANVQMCIRYTDQTIWDVIYDLLVTYAKIPAEFIDKDEWDAEGLEWLVGFNITSLLSKPTGVGVVLSEILQQVLAYIWWDERSQKIKFRALRAIPNAGTINDHSNILENSVTITTEPKERISQLWIYWNQRNAALPLDNEANYDSLRIRADLSAESPEKYGEAKIRKIFARWIQTDAQAIILGTRFLEFSIDNPRSLRLRVDAKDRSYWTGDVLKVEHRNIVDQFGEPTSERYQILSAEEVQPGEVIEYHLQSFAIRVARVGFYTESDALNFDDYTESEIEAQQLSFYCDESGQMPDGSTGWEYQ
jgi:hypothetical protein